MADRRRGVIRAVLLMVLAAVLPGCAPELRELILASTTSTEDSELFDSLIPVFEDTHPEYAVKVIAVGSGQALELGRRKDADVLLVHAPPAEVEFVDAGYGESRRDVMYNDFVLLGPLDDRADLRTAESATQALQRVATVEAPFVSRGDDSGTHRKEQALWRSASVRPDPSWHMEVGQGMAEALRIASERRAYTISDRATFLALRDALHLQILLEGDSALFNPYAVVVVAGARNVEGARAFAEWITGDDAQSLIAEFGADRFGQPLFVPNATSAVH